MQPTVGAGMRFSSYVVRTGVWGMGADDDTLPGVIAVSVKCPMPVNYSPVSLVPGSWALAKSHKHVQIIS